MFKLIKPICGNHLFTYQIFFPDHEAIGNVKGMTYRYKNLTMKCYCYHLFRFLEVGFRYFVLNGRGT